MVIAQKDAVATKDYLLGLLHSAADVPATIEVVKLIVVILRHTMGLWLDAGSVSYAYKGMEIAQECVKECDALLQMCGHWKQQELIEHLRDECRQIAIAYYKANYDRFNPPTFFSTPAGAM